MLVGRCSCNTAIASETASRAARHASAFASAPLLLANASPLLRVLGAQCFAAWSLAQLATSSASLLSPADASNRVAFHGALVVANTLCSAWAVMREC